LSSSFVNIKHLVGFSSMPTHIQTRGWSFLPTLIQKQVIMGSRLKEHHYNKLPNSFFMDHIFKVFSYLTSLPTSHFLDFLLKTFGIHKLFINETINILFSYHYIINSCTNCEFKGRPPWIKCLNAKSKILLQIYYYNTTRIKTKR